MKVTSSIRGTSAPTHCKLNAFLKGGAIFQVLVEVVKFILVQNRYTAEFDVNFTFQK